MLFTFAETHPNPLYLNGNHLHYLILKAPQLRLSDPTFGLELVNQLFALGSGCVFRNALRAAAPARSLKTTTFICGLRYNGAYCKRLERRLPTLSQSSPGEQAATPANWPMSVPIWETKWWH